MVSNPKKTVGTQCHRNINVELALPIPQYNIPSNAGQVPELRGADSRTTAISSKSAFLAVFERKSKIVFCQ